MALPRRSRGYEHETANDAKCVVERQGWQDVDGIDSRSADTDIKSHGRG
jgi:hypothetical protein